MNHPARPHGSSPPPPESPPERTAGAKTAAQPILAVPLVSRCKLRECWECAELRGKVAHYQGEAVWVHQQYTSAVALAADSQKLLAKQISETQRWQAQAKKWQDKADSWQAQTEQKHEWLAGEKRKRLEVSEKCAAARQEVRTSKSTLKTEQQQWNARYTAVMQ